MEKKFVKAIHFMGFILFMFLSGVNCKGPTDAGGNKINPDLKEIKFSNPKLSPDFYMAVWRGNTIFPIQGLSKFVLDAEYNVLQDTLLEANIKWGNWTYIDANSFGSKLLLVEKTYIDGTPSGSLYEYDVNSGQLQLLYERSRNIASARYHPQDDTKIIYYTFGDSLNTISPGYYLRTKKSQVDSLLFPYLSSAGVWETLHGFDIHPNENSLLIPISRCVGQFNHASPKLGIVSLNKQKLDTLDINFDMSFFRTGLYVRYNRSGSKILYCCFPENAYGYVTNDNSEVGIIDASTLTKKILNADTYGKELGSVQLAPNWSPDENAIVFGSGQVISSGQAGKRHLYILKLN